MTDPIAFTSATPRLGLPMLFAGQTQKEFHVNQAHALMDMLVHPCVEGEASSPPAEPLDGECWLVGGGAQRDWSGHDGELAGFQAGTWVFAAPQPGMRAFDKATGGTVFFSDGWTRSEPVDAPGDESGIEPETRAVLVAIIQSLSAAGIIRRQ